MGRTQRFPAPAPANDAHGAEPPEGQGAGGGERVGIAGAGSAVGVAFLLGGIVAQLIQDAEDRRAEVVNCIDISGSYVMTADERWFWEIRGYCCSVTRFLSLQQCHEDFREWIGDF